MPPRMSSLQRQSAWPPHIESKAEARNSAATATPPGVQGVWQNGTFRFHSPEAIEAWRRKSYSQGVSENNWHLGDEVDDKTRDLALAGLGGPMAPMYQGPDGKYRFANAKTIEDKEVRDHRLKYLQGKTIDQIADKMPGEDEYIEKRKAGQVVAPQSGRVDPRAHRSVAAPSAQLPANDNGPTNAEAKGVTVPPVKDKALPTNVGRFGPVPTPTQDEKDAERLFLQGLTGNSADNIRAASTALGKWWSGTGWRDAYSEALVREESETEKARQRQGLMGVSVEALPGFIPILGDVSGVVADAKDWLEHGDDWGWKDYGLVAAGILPEVANRRTLKKGKEAFDQLLGDGKKLKKTNGDSLVTGGPDNAPDINAIARQKLEAQLLEAKNNPISVMEARNLTGEHRGLIFVEETQSGPAHARRYEDESPGAFSSVKHKKPARPALRLDNPDGVNYIKFDSVVSADDGLYLVLIDSKSKIAPPIQQAREKLRETLERVGAALSQNNDQMAGGPMYKVLYDFPTQAKAEEAEQAIRKLGLSGVVTVRVRAASDAAQEEFWQLRER